MVNVFNIYSLVASETYLLQNLGKMKPYATAMLHNCALITKEQLIFPKVQSFRFGTRLRETILKMNPEIQGSICGIRWMIHFCLWWRSLLLFTIYTVLQCKESRECLHEHINFRYTSYRKSIVHRHQWKKWQWASASNWFSMNWDRQGVCKYLHGSNL